MNYDLLLNNTYPFCGWREWRWTTLVCRRRRWCDHRCWFHYTDTSNALRLPGAHWIAIYDTCAGGKWIGWLWAKTLSELFQIGMMMFEIPVPQNPNPERHSPGLSQGGARHWSIVGLYVGLSVGEFVHNGTTSASGGVLFLFCSFQWWTAVVGLFETGWPVGSHVGLRVGGVFTPTAMH